MSVSETDDGAEKGRICPACGAVLVTVERQDVEIERCPNCRGVWLDRGELEKLVALNDDDEDHYERPIDDDSEEAIAASKLATRRSFFAELFDKE
jgi:Zn-finger nucleic acid-binding protein